MTAAIQIAGLILSAAFAAAALRPDLRLPVLALAILSIPGNVDNLLPQMTLDRHALADREAPAISVVDLLLVWAVALTVLERRDPGRMGRRFVGAAAAIAVIATVAALANLLRGVEPLAVARGIVVFLRIVALLYLAFALSDLIGNRRLLAGAIVLGGVALLANGAYTTSVADVDRFTASTFGRNGFALALVLATIVSAGLAFHEWSHWRRGWRAMVAIAVAISVSAASLFGAAATGTRMSLLVFFAAGAGALIGRGSPGLAFFRRVAVVMVAVVLVLAASTAWTPGGGRAVSVVTRPDNTVDAVIEPETVAEGSEVRTRNQFWSQAIRMAQEQPLVGVGPFQWNIERYRLDPAGPRVVADSHNAYLQIAAEYGIVVLMGYVLLLAACLIVLMVALLRRQTFRVGGWVGLAFALAGLAFVAADLTNSHLFNVRNGAFGWMLIAVATALAMSGRSIPERDAPADQAG